MNSPESRFHSQFGEDRILSDIFEGRRSGVCVEVGAHDGITGSTTLHFERLGWDCVLVEPIPELCERIRGARTCKVFDCAASSEPGEAVFFVADGDASLSALSLDREQKKRIARQGSAVREIRVVKKTLDQVLREAGVEKTDFVTIDVEGHELEVLRGFSVEVFRPRVIIVEDNSNQADRRIPDYLADRGYLLVRRTGVNDWYARRTDAALTEPEAVARQLRERSRMRFENRIKRRFAFLERLLPESVKDRLRRGLRRVSGRVLP